MGSKLIILLLSTSWLLAQEPLFEVEGAPLIGNDSMPVTGTIRWTGNDFEGFNGTYWVSLTGKMLGKVQDFDGNTYNTIKIGDQEWMIDNLRTSHFRNGDTIPEVVDFFWNGLRSSAWCKYEDSDSLESIYGKLYNWYAVIDGDELCPMGWRVPSSQDWNELLEYLEGGSIGIHNRVAAKKLIERGIMHWPGNDMTTTNQSGFTGLPAGVRNQNGDFSNLGTHSYFWSTSYVGDNPWVYFLHFDSEGPRASYSTWEKNHACSVRCIKE